MCLHVLNSGGSAHMAFGASVFLLGAQFTQGGVPVNAVSERSRGRRETLVPAIPGEVALP